MFEWISRPRNNAASCLSRLVKLPNNNEASVMMLTATNSDGPVFNTWSQTSQQCQITKDTRPSNTPSINKSCYIWLNCSRNHTGHYTKTLNSWETWSPTRDAECGSICRHISKRLSNGKAPQHEADIFINVKGLLYKHITDANQKFLALIIPKAWKYTVLVEVHD